MLVWEMRDGKEVFLGTLLYYNRGRHTAGLSLKHIDAFLCCQDITDR